MTSPQSELPPAQKHDCEPSSTTSCAAPPPRLATWRRVVGSSFFKATVLIMFVAWTALWWINSLGGLGVFREQYGAVAPAITLPVHMAVASLPIPTDVICIANGALYGFWFGAFLSWCGWYVGALVKFWLGRRAREDFDLESGMQKLPKYLRIVPIEHPAFLIGSRMIPWLGGSISTFLPGAAGVKYRRHLWCSAIAIIPGAVLTAGIGAGLFGLTETEEKLLEVRAKHRSQHHFSASTHRGTKAMNNGQPPLTDELGVRHRSAAGACAFACISAF